MVLDFPQSCKTMENVPGYRDVPAALVLDFCRTVDGGDANATETALS